MLLTSGTRLGPYSLLAKIGAGGMGEVYRARDTRLDRTVAIKVLPPEVAQDADRRARFEREAKAIAALSHPHICTLHDVGEHGGTAYLVMELVEGQTLAARLEKGALPLDHALAIAGQIADALAAAHRQGIVHRDLKPANVMLTKSGAKLLDFGLAKLRLRTGPVALGGASDTATATGASAGTAEGTFLGTIHYMAPEQVEGKEADHRADIWALGAVLYEMVTGAPPFRGDTAASLIGAILKDTPAPPSTRQALSPRMLDGLVARCLEKDADARWQAAGDVRHALAWASASQADARPSATPVRAGRRVLGLALVAAALALVLGGAAWLGRPGSRPLLDVRFSVLPEPGTALWGVPSSVVSPHFAISPDGRYLAFVATEKGRSAIWLRPLNANRARILAGTDGAKYPFWSPDSDAIGFAAQGRLMTVALDGAPPVARGEATSAYRGGTWLADGSIVFSPDSNATLRRITPATETAPYFTGAAMKAASSDLFPVALPDRRHVLFVHRSPDESQRGTYLASPSGDLRTRLFDGDWSPISVDDYVLYLRGSAMLAQRLDLGAGRMVGDPTVVLEKVGGNTGGFMAASISSNGTLAYAEPWPTDGQLVWYSRDGRPLGQPIGPVSDYVDLTLSRDGETVAFSKVDPQTATSDVWLVEVARGILTRLTSDRSNEAGPFWTADGRSVIFRTSRRGPNEFYSKDIDGANAEQLRIDPSRFGLGLLIRGQYSPDGAHLVLTHAGDSIDIVRLTGETTAPIAVAASRFDEYHAALSADGRWIAYVSEESGTPQVMVQSFPDGARRVQVSSDGGSEPQWRADGKELYFLRFDSMLMAVPVTPGAGPLAGTPTPLFQTRVPLHANAYRINYVVTGDGERFLVNTAPPDARPPEIHIVLDWRTLLARGQSK